MIRQVLILVLVAVVIYIIWVLFIRGAKPTESSLYSELVSRCMGDRGQAERLIEFEKTRAPEGYTERAELIARALRRLERDKHR